MPATSQYTPAVTDTRSARVMLSCLADTPSAAMHALINQYGPVELINRLQASATDSSNRTEATLQHRFDALSTDTLSRLRAICTNQQIGVIVPEDPYWPRQLNDLDEPPIMLYFRGAGGQAARAAQYLAHITQPVAVIGSREISEAGQKAIKSIVPGLVSSGSTIISGGAYGCDIAAHRAALQTPSAPQLPTVAVLANGLDSWYPAAHRSDFEAICADGAGLVLSEHPPGVRPNRSRLLGRNRLIVALAQVTVAIEAGARSGTKSAYGHAQTLSRTLLRAAAPLEAGLSAGTRDLNVPAVSTSHEVLGHILTQRS